MSRPVYTVLVRADEDEDDCLAAAVAEIVDTYPEVEGYDLDPRWHDDDREWVAVDIPRTTDLWWSWHDADADRASESQEKAEARASAWVAGESEDGPSGAS